MEQSWAKTAAVTYQVTAVIIINIFIVQHKSNIIIFFNKTRLSEIFLADGWSRWYDSDNPSGKGDYELKLNVPVSVIFDFQYNIVG